MEDLVLTREQSRSVDTIAIQHFGIPGVVLMENAGRGVVDVLLSVEPSLVGHDHSEALPVAILCGVGNNAGDGFVIARHLQIRGVACQVFLLGSPARLRGDALLNYQILTQSDVNLVDLSSEVEPSSVLTAQASGAAWYIDALLGTGATGEPREPFAAAIAWMNCQAGKRLAVDLPSGLDCDTGEPSEVTFRADHTCTFVAKKLGFSQSRAQRYVGQVHVVSIGIPRQVVKAVLA